MRALTLVWTLLLMAIAPHAHADDARPVRGFEYRSIESGGETYRYARYVPRTLELSADAPAPMIVFLHGYGECGTDGQRQLAVGLAPRLVWNPELYPAVVLFPQKPTGESEWEDHAHAVEAMIDAAMRDLPIDPDRVALTGLSQGGHGVWALNERMPDRFSALAPVCGYAERRFDPSGQRVGGPVERGELTDRLVEAARGKPVRIFHGARDDVIPADESRAMAGRLEAAGADVELTIYPDAGHNSWDAAYGEPTLGPWLVAQRRR
jgi:predicted peptidase